MCEMLHAETFFDCFRRRNLQNLLRRHVFIVVALMSDLWAGSGLNFRTNFQLPAAHSELYHCFSLFLAAFL